MWIVSNLFLIWISVKKNESPDKAGCLRLWKITITTELYNTLGRMFTMFEWSISWSGQPLTQCIPPKLSDSSIGGKLSGSFCHCMFLTVQRVTWSPPSYSSCPSVLSLPPWGHSQQVSSLFPKTVLKLSGESLGVLLSLPFRLNIPCFLGFGDCFTVMGDLFILGSVDV